MTTNSILNINKFANNKISIVQRKHLFCSKADAISSKKTNEFVFPTTNNFVPFASPFVDVVDYTECTMERIIWPTKNFSSLIPHIANELNELTRHTFQGMMDIGIKSIETQLTQTKF